jgi:2-methylisocitrate lyase-like PEP mutase family enzyme
MKSKTETLRALLDGEQQFTAPETITVLGGRIAERIGFPALYVGSHSLGSFHYGIPDYGILEPHEVIEQTSRIAHGVSIPTIVDADELGGNVAAVHRAVRDYIAAGISGIHFEDDQDPKHSTWRQPLLTIEDMQARIAAAAAARTDPNFVLIVRSNELLNRGAFGNGTLDGAIKRGQAYAEAGADAYITPGATADEFPVIAESISIPYSAFSTPAGQNNGVHVILYAGFATSSASKYYETVAREYFSNGAVSNENSRRADNLYDLLEETTYDNVIRKWAEDAGMPVDRTLHATQASK